MHELEKDDDEWWFILRLWGSRDGEVQTGQTRTYGGRETGREDLSSIFGPLSFSFAVQEIVRPKMTMLRKTKPIQHVKCSLRTLLVFINTPNSNANPHQPTPLLATNMCSKVDCRNCGLATWQGCGMHGENACIWCIMSIMWEWQWLPSIVLSANAHSLLILLHIYSYMRSIRHQWRGSMSKLEERNLQALHTR